MLAALVGGGAGYLSLHAGDIGNAAARLLPECRKAAPRPPPSGWVFYADCDAARAAGQAPIRFGEPGYRAELDADGDGTAGEPYRGHRSHRHRMRFHF